MIGFGAILLWGMLALLTSFCSEIPPLQLTAMTFLLAFIASIFAFIRSGSDFSILKQPVSVWLNGVIGLFGYHALYFMAMQHAPAVEASLINYLWPVLIVLLSAFQPGEKLSWFPVAGVILGFAGVIQLLLGSGGLQFDSRYTLGYLLAFACAIIWSLYSVISRKFKSAPTLLIGAFCGCTAVLSFICHLLFEKTVMPRAWEWLPIIMLGLGPVGLAFFTWDYGVKHGNIKLLGALSYIAPLLSSILLICFGRTRFSWNILLACGLIIGGSVVASFQNRKGKDQTPPADKPDNAA